MTACAVCGLQGASEERQNDAIEYRCPACGAFVLTGTAVASIQTLLQSNSDARPLLSHLLRVRNPNATPHTTLLSDQDLRALIEGNKLPTPAELSDNLITVLGNKSTLGQHIALITDEIRSAIGARSNDGILAVARYLYSEGRIEIMGGERGFNMGMVNAALTVPGWNRYREIQTIGVVTRTAFMAMQFNDTRVEQAYRNAFIPAANDCGFELQRLDERQPAGLIDDQLRVRIRNCAFVVADITTANHGAYWEAGFAEGLGKPVIYTCEMAAFANGASHFDTNHHLTVSWDLDNLQTTRSRLAATIRATLPTLAKLSN